MNPPFEVSADDQRVLVRGELDVATAPELERVLTELIDGGRAQLVVDLSDCGFIDSAGLSAIVRASRRLDGDRGGNGDRALTVIAPNHQTRRLLELVDVHPYLRVTDSAGG